MTLDVYYIFILIYLSIYLCGYVYLVYTSTYKRENTFIGVI